MVDGAGRYAGAPPFVDELFNAFFRNVGNGHSFEFCLKQVSS